MLCCSSIKLLYISLLCLFLFDGTTVFAQNAKTRTQGKATQLIVDGKPVGDFSVGHWGDDKNGLPCFHYTGKVPQESYLPNGDKANVPDDPWFLLGNYQLTLFAHASGRYELITGQRSWARMNQGADVNSGESTAIVEIDGGKVKKNLTEEQAKERIFGCGYAIYRYSVSDLEIERRFDVAPSEYIRDGVPTFLVSIKIRNLGKTRKVKYTESLLANYMQMQYQRQGSMPLQFTRKLSLSDDKSIVKATFTAQSDDPLLLPSEDRMAAIDAYAPTLYLNGLSSVEAGYDEEGNLYGNKSLTLKRGETATVKVVIGYCFDDSDAAILSDASTLRDITDFGMKWKRVIPEIADEKDTILRRELRWHAYNLEAMATYSRHYGETKIPQGTIYDYDWGQHASARDNFQHALPLVYYNPELCKSVMRYMAQRTTPYGDIRLIEYGNGFAETLPYCTSDQQLFFFQLISEYLRVTKDYAFLDEQTECFPKGSGASCSMLETTEHCFKYLKDVISRGQHGLVRLLNSDWNDNVFVLNKVVYNDVIYTAESHLNSAMAIAILDKLSAALRTYSAKTADKSRKTMSSNLAVSMEQYRHNVLESFLKDLGDRTFTRRMYFEGKPIGDDNMYIEPQGFMLQIKELDEARKRRLYEEMQTRIYNNEKLGARQQQQPDKEGYGLEKGSRENGGMWYSMNGPIIVGLATFDKEEAMKRLRQLSFSNYARQFPQYWTSYWSASDNIESSLMPSEGLADQSLNYHTIPVFCAHPHAWLLYCYYKIREE